MPHTTSVSPDQVVADPVGFVVPDRCVGAQPLPAAPFAGMAHARPAGSAMFYHGPEATACAVGRVAGLCPAPALAPGAPADCAVLLRPGALAAPLSGQALVALTPAQWGELGGGTGPVDVRYGSCYPAAGGGGTCVVAFPGLACQPGGACQLSTAV